jgi:hypothetical protein
MSRKVRRGLPSLALATVLGCFVTALPRAAPASCAPPASTVLWSYPENGAVEVPLDADLLVSGDVGGSATLNGAPLTLLEPGMYDLGVLEPETRYEVAWSTAVIAFETGTQRANPGSLDLEGNPLELTRDPVLSDCPLTLPQGCFDTGPPARVQFEPPVGALAWLVDVQQCDGSSRTVLWPSGCGAPVVWSYDPIVCARLRRFNGNGVGAATDLFCSTPSGSLASIPRSGACAGRTWPPADAVVINAGAADTPGGAAGASEDPDSQSPDSDSGPDESAPPDTTSSGCAVGAGSAGASLAGSAALLALALLRTRRRGA